MVFFVNERFKKFIFFFSFFYLIFYIPFSISVYSSTWYEINFESQNIYEKLEKDYVDENKKNIIGFFLHKSDLNDNWLYEEKIHLKDVRIIYDILFAFGIIFFFLFAYFFKKSYFRIMYFTLNIVFTFILLLILPFFRFFWDEIFHPLLFRNDYWIIIKDSLFYYFFPISFFINSFVFIVAFSIAVNIIIIFSIWFKNRKDKNIKK